MLHCYAYATLLVHVILLRSTHVCVLILRRSADCSALAALPQLRKNGAAAVTIL
jgi:hypothetical protein